MKIMVNGIECDDLVLRKENKKKISIYELLGLIKDGKAPKEVKYKETKYVFNDTVQCYENRFEWFPSIQEIGLNDEVEIIEEDEFIDIEELKMGYPEDNPSNKYIINEYGTKCYLTKHSRIMADRINDLIKNQKKIINKLKEEGK